MITRLSNIMFRFLLVAAFGIAGCGGKSDPLAKGPKDEKIGIITNYVSEAAEASGGYMSWRNVKKIEADSVATFYRLNGSSYLTKQRYEIYPWSNSVRISGDEPKSSFIWELSKRGSKKSRSRYIGSAFADELFSKEYFTELMLDIMTAPVRLLDVPVAFSKEPQPIKVEGLWYYPIKRTIRPDEPVGSETYWSKAIFYQRAEISMIDMVWFSGIERGKFLAARGYDYKKVEKSNVLLPAKIEIFKTDTQGVLKQRLVTINFTLITTN